MKRVYISYATADRDAALYITTQLRADGVDAFYDPERMVAFSTPSGTPSTASADGFSRRLEKEIRSRACVLFIQSPEALKSPLVQTELEFAYHQQAEIIPLVLKPLNIRETGEFRFLLNLSSVDFGGWQQQKRAQNAFVQLENRLQNASDHTIIKIRNAADLQPMVTLRGHNGWIRKVAFSPDGYLLASCASDNAVCIWDIHSADRTGNPPQLFTRMTEYDKMVWGLEFAPCHALLATGAGNNLLQLWDLNSLPTPYEFTRFTDHRQPVYSLAYSPDGSLLASASHDNTVVVRDVSYIDVTGQASDSITLLHTAHVYRVVFSPDNRWLASTSRDSAVRLWSFDSDSLQNIARTRPLLFKGHTSWVNDAAFAPNGLVMASAGNDGTIRLWDVEACEEITVLNGHQDAVNAVAFSADGSLLASAAKDDTVRLWDVERLRELTTIHGHERGVNSVAFSPDGTKLITGSGDSTIKIWTVDGH